MFISYEISIQKAAKNLLTSTIIIFEMSQNYLSSKFPESWLSICLFEFFMNFVVVFFYDHLTLVTYHLLLQILYFSYLGTWNACTGFGAYLVGGCVRDLILHKTPKDFDIVTTADLRQVSFNFEYWEHVIKNLSDVIIFYFL